MFGKWHNGTYHPRSRGFETFYGFTSGHWGHYFIYSSPMIKSCRVQVINDDVTEHAMTFIKDRKTVFCYLAFNTPHSPMQLRIPIGPIRRQGASHAPPRPRKGKSGSHEGGTGHAKISTGMLDVYSSCLISSLAEDTIVVFSAITAPMGTVGMEHEGAQRIHR